MDFNQKEVTFAGSPVRTAGIFVILVSLVFLCSLEVLSPHFFFWDDNSTFHLPWYIFNYRTVVENGTVPLINFHQFCGQPYFAQGQRGIFYPFIYIAIWLSQVFADIVSAIDILIIFHLVSGTFAMYLLVRKLGARNWISVLTSLVYLTTPFFVVSSRSWIHVAYTFMFMPLMQLLVESLLRKRTLALIASLSLVKALFFWQGYYEYVFYVTGFELFLLIIRRWLLGVTFRPGFIGDYIVANLLFLILVLPGALLFIQAMQESAYRASPLPLNELLEGAVNLRNFLWAQLFNFNLPSFGEGNAQIYFLGSLFPILALSFWTYQQKSRLSPYVALFLFLAITALLISTELRVLLTFLPPFDRMRWPFKTLVFFAFYSTIGLGLLVEQLIEYKFLQRGVAFAILLVVVGLNVIALFPLKEQRLFGHYQLASLEDSIRAKLGTDGRVLAYELDAHDRAISLSTTFNFPTMFGLFGLAGYDPIRTTINSIAGMGLDHASVLRGSLTESRLDHLNKWSVRYIVTANNPKLDEILNSSPHLSLRYRESNIAILTNENAHPFAFFEDQKSKALPIKFLINRMVISTKGRTGSILLSLVPLPGYRVITAPNQNALGEREGQLLLTKYSHDDEVVVEYESPIYNAFYLYPFIGLSVILCMMMATLIHRASDKKRATTAKR